MLAAKITTGDHLMLKADNPYGLEGWDRLIVVAAITTKPGYRTPWIHDTHDRAFRPSDFEKAVS